jgi:hypothetical protein
VTVLQFEKIGLLTANKHVSKSQKRKRLPVKKYFFVLAWIIFCSSSPAAVMTCEGEEFSDSLPFFATVEVDPEAMTLRTVDFSGISKSRLSLTELDFTGDGQMLYDRSRCVQTVNKSDNWPDYQGLEQDLLCEDNISVKLTYESFTLNEPSTRRGFLEFYFGTDMIDRIQFKNCK